VILRKTLTNAARITGEFYNGDRGFRVADRKTVGVLMFYAASKKFWQNHCNAEKHGGGDGDENEGHHTPAFLFLPFFANYFSFALA